MASAKIQRMSKSGKQKSGQKAKGSDVPDEIQCKICKKRYEDPKLLPCLHTFCKPCLEQSVENHNGTLYCPVCPTKINSSEFFGVEKLQSNYMISNLLQAIDLKKGLSSKQCESCEEDVTAISRCFECSDFLCANCVEAHKRVRFTKNHRVVAIKNLNADAMVKTPTCATHAQEALKMYCKQCKKPVCRPCILSEHDEHVLISLKEAVDDNKPKLNALLIATRAKIPILQRQLKGVHAAKDKLESKVDEVIKEIQATSARILMAVKRREKDLYKMLRRIHDQKSDELESRELALENDLAQVLDGCDFAEELGKSGDEGMVLHVTEMTCIRLRDLSGKQDGPVPEIADNEIEYFVNEKPVLDELKIYGKVLSKEQKAKQELKEKRNGKEGNGKEKKGNRENEKLTETSKVGQEEAEKQQTVERRPSWLQTLANPRALIRRLSFGGDEMEQKKPEETSDSKGKVATKDARWPRMMVKLIVFSRRNIQNRNKTLHNNSNSNNKREANFKMSKIARENGQTPHRNPQQRPKPSRYTPYPTNPNQRNRKRLIQVNPHLYLRDHHPVNIPQHPQMNLVNSLITKVALKNLQDPTPS